MRAQPTLPQNATDAAARRDHIARRREDYAYDFSYADLCFVKSLPLRDEFPPRYLLQGAEVTIKLQANRAAAKLGSWVGKDPSALEAWSKMFPLLPAPLAMAHAKEDWCFAWQRLAGPTPNAIQRIERLPEALPITDVDLRRVLGDEKASVAGALAGARLYVADYALFDGVATGVTDGHAKFLWAPIVLFCVDRSFAGSLRPIAIQTAGHTGRKDTLYLPGDSDWMLARTAANVADENLQGVLVHLGWCHMVIERFILASYRQLSEDHPLAVLLAPHFETTLAVNQVARKSVVNPGGVQDRLLAPTIEAQTAILNRSVASLDLASLDPTIDYARRGVGDVDALPSYPFRDDALPIWSALRRFVEAYVRLYYASDADVTGDGELAAFVREVGAADGGRLPAMVAGVAPKTVGDVVDLISRILFRATAYHATINNSNYDWAAYVPSMPTCGASALPPRGSDASLSAMFPPSEIGWETITATYQVANLHINWLGQYDADHFVDGRVAPLVKQFQADLATIESDTTTRNAARPLPYTFLLPSRITASINA